MNYMTMIQTEVTRYFLETLKTFMVFFLKDGKCCTSV